MTGSSRVERLGTEKIGKLLLEMASQTTFSLLVYAIYQRHPGQCRCRRKSLQSTSRNQ